MFDWLSCEMSLPGPGDASSEFQTKSLDRTLAKITIHEDGSVTERYVQYKDVPLEERPYGKDENPLLHFIGSIEEIPESVKEIPVHFTGVLNFYDFLEDSDEGWIEYNAEVKDGHVISIERIILPEGY
jgi:hypothetical protein